MARNSNNLEGSLFSSQYPKMERSSSFREGESRAAAGTPRSTQHGSDIPPLTQYLNLELPIREQQQKSRSAELRRMLGTGLDDHGFGSAQSKAAVPAINPEEMKRFKASLSESASKAGESAKFFQDQVAKVDKYKNVVAKKRQQRSSDVSGEKSGGSNFPKNGGSHSGSPVNQVLPNEHMSQRQDDRPKNLIPNKRARSSLGESRSEGRALGSTRQVPSNSEKDKSTSEKDKGSAGRVTGNGGPTTSEEKPRALAPGGDGWEKKLKRKRSVGSMVNRANDGANSDSKQSSASPRPNVSNTESRRSNDNNGLGFRSGLPSGTVGGVNKTDLSSQQSSGNGTRSSVKVENDNNNPTERREQRSSALDKDRSVSKGNKLVPRDESQGSSLNPTAKTKASRAPRTNSFVVMNSSPTFPRFPNSSSDGWDSPSNNANKPQNNPTPIQSTSNAAPATSNRKRPVPPSAPPSSPSPPVTQWVGTRPQKIQRTRRANVVSPVSNFDEIQIQTPNDGSAASPSATVHNSTGNSSGTGTVMQQHKSKGDVSSPLAAAGLSESEESKGKGVENGEIMAENNKAAAPFLTNKKGNNRVLLKEELGDGVIRRQGRSGRGNGMPRSLPPLPKEKTDGSNNESITKPPKSGRPVSDKNDSRIGRPPLKKVDRKSQGRPVQNSHATPSEMIGGMDDDKEELLSVINAARIACYDACTGPFWKKMEPIFTSASNDLSFLKNQIAFAEALDRSASDVIADKYNNEEKDTGQSSPSSHKTTVDPTLIRFTDRNTKTDENWFVQAVPISQMLLSAFISDDNSEPLPYSNEYISNGDTDRYSYEKVDNKGQCNGFLDGTLLTSSHSHNHNGAYSQSIEKHEMVDKGALYECPYEDMSLDDRILLELHSIGVYPDNGPELDEGEGAIDMSASELQKELTQKVKERKSIMQTLANAFPDTKRIDERHLEHLTMDKLVERACKKLSGGRGGGSSHKGGVNKLSKQLAQAFGKRTLDRCRKFEGSGQSCFSSDPSLRDVLFAPLQRPDSKQPDGVNERRKLDRCPSDAFEHSQLKTDHISNRGKKREVLLEEVSRGGSTSIFGPRWKKSDHTKDNNNSGKNSSNTNTNAKGGGGRGERKTKTKPKQKNSDIDRVIMNAEMGQLGGVNGSNNNRPGQHKNQLPNNPVNEMNDGLFAGLPIPFDDLDSVVTGDANDLGSWLNVDDESLQDTDLVGLEIPMDDLADLTFT